MLDGVVDDDNVAWDGQYWIARFVVDLKLPNSIESEPTNDQLNLDLFCQ